MPGLPTRVMGLQFRSLGANHGPGLRPVMVPITHVLYLAFALFFVGLCGVLCSRRLLSVWVSIELLILSLCLAMVACARQWGDLEGQVFAVVGGVLGTAVTTVGAGLVVAHVRRGHRADMASLDQREEA